MERGRWLEKARALLPIQLILLSKKKILKLIKVIRMMMNDDGDEDDENLVHLLINEKIKLKIAILKIAERNPSCALTNQIYCKCYQRKRNLHVNVTLNIRYFWEMSPSLHVSGLLMPFTGEESKSLEFLVDCYNQSKKFKKATKLE